MIDYALVKSQNPIEYVVQDALGAPDKESGNRLWWKCPFHHEDTPSFCVDINKQTFTCYGACNDGGDVFNFVQWHYFGRMDKGRPDFSDENDVQRKAYEFLSGQSLSDEKKKKREEYQRQRTQKAKKEKKAQVVEYQRVLDWHQHRDTTVDYFVNVRHLPEAFVDTQLLGTYTASPWFYKYADGTREYFEARRYTIPYLYGKWPRIAQTRLDDVYCRGAIALMNQNIIDKIKEDYFRKKGVEPTIDDLVSLMFGPKYKREGQGAYIFNVNRMLALNNGEIVMENGFPRTRRLDFVLVNEAEISAMTAEAAGRISIAAQYRSSVPWSQLFRNVTVPIIVADNDGGTGMSKAAQLAEAIGNPRVRIITPPDPYKDINEMPAPSLEKFFSDNRIPKVSIA